MGCCLSSHRRHRSETHDDSPPDYLPDDDDHHHHLPNNRPPPNLALISSVRTLRSHLAMSPPSTPFNPRRPSSGEEDRILRDHHEEILYPIRFTQKHVSSSNPRVGGGRYCFVGNNQIAALDREVDHVFDDLSTATTTTTAAAFNFSKEAQIGGDDRTPSSRVGSGQWSIGSPTPVPLAEIWKRQNHRPPPPPPADMWSSTAAPAKLPARALSKREVMSRRERERERGIRWDPSPETDFSDTSASTDSTTSAERRHRSTSMMESNRKAPRKVTFGELPMMRKGGDFEDGPGPGPRAARRVARSRPGGWSPPEVSESFEGWSLGTTTGGGSGRKQRQMGHGGMATAPAARGREDDVLIRQRIGSEYEPTNDLLSMEGFVFF
ncbi:unnamed protein product [Linum trigynum]|uniref:Uncharacterized protein n=1 Tax=Linum trigynum TaxID=586398 RepID=A0AAV2G7K6_9ROSI